MAQGARHRAPSFVETTDGKAGRRAGSREQRLKRRGLHQELYWHQLVMVVITLKDFGLLL